MVGGSRLRQWEEHFRRGHARGLLPVLTEHERPLRVRYLQQSRPGRYDHGPGRHQLLAAWPTRPARSQGNGVRRVLAAPRSLRETAQKSAGFNSCPKWDRATCRTSPYRFWTGRAGTRRVPGREQTRFCDADPHQSGPVRAVHAKHRVGPCAVATRTGARPRRARLPVGVETGRHAPGDGRGRRARLLPALHPRVEFSDPATAGG
jgi:hypothetical protein